MKSCEVIKISEESIKNFKEKEANTDRWMIYYFKIFVQLDSEGVVETEAQIFMDISNIINSVDNLLLFHRNSVLFDSGGKYSIGFDFINHENIKLWVRNGEEKNIFLDYLDTVKSIYSLLGKVYEICSFVESPSNDLINTIHLIKVYLHILKLNIDEYHRKEMMKLETKDMR